MEQRSPYPQGRHSLRALQVATGMMVCAAAALLGCPKDSTPAQGSVELGRRAPRDAQTSEETETAGRAYRARRCGECHAAAARTWKASAHARADSSPVYRAMRAAAKRDDCDRCHAPLRGLVAKDDPVAAEGVTCDVCHTMRKVRIDPAARNPLELEIASATRHGPLCDLDDHYFHKMGCSELHSSSDFCGSCHLWTTHTPTMDSLEVFSTYSDWRDGPYGKAEQTCQECHMPALAGAVAVGWSTAAPASDHGMFGSGDEVREQAILLEAAIEHEADRLELHVDVINAGAGHPLPAGLPGRRIFAHATALGADGAEIAREQRRYARVLVDGDGTEAPFYAAQRLESDTRLRADERRREVFSFDDDGVTQVRIEVLEYELSEALAARLGIDAPEPTVLASLRAVKKDPRGWEIVHP